MEELSDKYEFLFHKGASNEVDKDAKKGTFVRLPERSELNAEINEALIVEYYNR